MVRRGVCGAFVGSILLVASSASAEQTVQELERRGTAAMDRKDWPEAYEALSALWAVKRTGQVAGWLGQTEKLLGRCAAAIGHFKAALADPPPDRPVQSLSLIQRWMNECQSQVARVTVRGVPAETELFVDGVAAGRAPLSEEIVLDRGEHVLEARRSGQVVASTKMTAVPGQAQTVTLREETTSAAPSSALGPTGPSAAPPPVDYQPRQPPALERKPPLWPVYVGGGAVVVGLATAIGFHVASESTEDDLHDEQRRCTEGPGGASCARMEDAADRHDTQQLWSDVGAGVAALAAVGTAAYLVWAQPWSTRSTVSVSVSPRGDGGWAVIRGQF